MIELLVVIAIIAVLMGLLLPAIQKVREAANNTACKHKMRQIGIAFHNYHNAHDQFPVGYTSDASSRPGGGYILSGVWSTVLLPYFEQAKLETEGVEYDGTGTWIGYSDDVVDLYRCPSEGRSPFLFVANASLNQVFALTSYPAVGGTTTHGERISVYVDPEVRPPVGTGVSLSGESQDGIMFRDSDTSVADITDGTSNTLMAGERPPSPDRYWGWWAYWLARGDSILGTQENSFAYRNSAGDGNNYHRVYKLSNDVDRTMQSAPPGHYNCEDKNPWLFQPGDMRDYCHANHFWSLHPGGGNWLFADGSVRLLDYEAAPVTPALSTISGSELVNPDSY